ncbi:hypothetical protein ACFPN2_19330 [Steroidobacter flavus]|uniref:Secreted protein n=1 Tax=Steroidobacter flavus TaxID=1842136 RepID=A0ABV8SVX3_9GAMM
MKNAAKFLLGTALLAAAAAASAGEFVTVEVKARVTNVQDPAGMLGGQVTQGQLVTGSYKYDIHVPDDVSDPAFGYYVQPHASFKMAVGSLTFESDGVSTDRSVSVQPSASPGNSLAFIQFMSQANKPLPNGTPVGQIAFAFQDSNGYEPASDAMPTAAPSLPSFNISTAWVYGELNGQYYSVHMEIESTYSEGTESDLTISPGKSTFVSGQRFDVALLLPPGSDVVNVTSSLNGQPLAMSFPGNCYLAPPNSQNRPTILCPDAHLHLPAATGQYHVEWQVQLFDGTSIWNPVDWTVIQ